MDCSIIICTRNRAEALQQTLGSIRKLEVPSDLQVELILVDNGSSDRTNEVIRSARLSKMTVRNLYAGNPGKSRALNLAISKAEGSVLLFTADDVEPALDWIEKMVRPLLEMSCDAVTGRISLGEELHRPWLSSYHGVFLASTTPAETSPDS